MTDEETQETFEVPFGFTAWWTFNGTGGQVTIDTAGSTFDTVLAVYTGSPGSFTQVACVDDVSRSDVQPPGEGHHPHLRRHDLLGPGGRVRRRLGRLQVQVRSGS